AGDADGVGAGGRGRPGGEDGDDARPAGVHGQGVGLEADAGEVGPGVADQSVHGERAGDAEVAGRLDVGGDGHRPGEGADAGGVGGADGDVAGLDVFGERIGGDVGQGLIDEGKGVVARDDVEGGVTRDADTVAARGLVHGVGAHVGAARFD